MQPSYPADVEAEGERIWPPVGQKIVGKGPCGVACGPWSTPTLGVCNTAAHDRPGSQSGAADS
jgi:hypothetical protein